MEYKIKNLVFEGGGVLGIAYLGALQYLYEKDIVQNTIRVAGTSAGAVTACITCFNLPFLKLKKIADTLDYRKIPEKKAHPLANSLSTSTKDELEKTFGDLDCIIRLINDYGWYSSNYFYEWLKKQIAAQFNRRKKRPPYTFADFKNPHLHKEQRPFYDLYIIGTDISYKASRIFSYETTPNMEVAEAVRISMSIPLFFEAIKVNNYEVTKDYYTNIFSDGGVMRNYPINIFDTINFNKDLVDGRNMETLGSKFFSKTDYSEINNLLEYIKNLFLSLLQVQQDMYNHSPEDIARSIVIDTDGVSPVNFDITPGDATYNYLYQQGYEAAKAFFSKY